MALIIAGTQIYKHIQFRYSKLANLHFAYCPYRAVALMLYCVLEYLDTNNTYACVLFLDYRSAFNTTKPIKLTAKLADFKTLFPPNTIIKYAENTVILICIKGRDKSSYRGVVNNLTCYGEDNDLVLNIEKTKDLLIDFKTIPPSQKGNLFNES